MTTVSFHDLDLSWLTRDRTRGKKRYSRAPARARSDLPCPMIRTDTMDATWNPANGQFYESRSAYEKAVRQAGCEIVGNEVPKPRQATELPDPKQDIAQVMREKGVIG